MDENLMYGVIRFLDDTKHDQGIAEIKTLNFTSQMKIINILQSTRAVYGYNYCSITIYKTINDEVVFNQILG